MGLPTRQELDEFANALQLSIKTKIGGIACDGDNMEIKFDPQARDDDLHLIMFLKIFDADGLWRNQSKSFVVGNAAKFNWPRLTLFLLLTRLDEENISKLTELDEFAGEIAVKLGLKLIDAFVDSVKKCAQLISGKMEKEKMTIRELADATGLTQVSISNFRAGKDIRFSNLLKIVKALGMSIKIK